MCRSFPLALFLAAACATAVPAQESANTPCDIDPTLPATVAMEVPAPAGQASRVDAPVLPFVGGFCGHCAGYTTEAPALAVRVHGDPPPGFSLTLGDDPNTPVEMLVVAPDQETPFCLYAVDGDLPVLDPREPAAGEYLIWILTAVTPPPETVTLHLTHE